MARKFVDPLVKEEYLEWLLVPPGQRIPPTKTAFAAEHDIAHNTLLYWERSDEFQNKLIGFKRKMASAWYADILGGLYELSQNGPPAQRVAASKLLLDHLNVHPNEDEVEEMSDEAKAAIRLVLVEQGYTVVDE